MNAKLGELLQELLEGTRAGALEWAETAEPGTYRLMLDKGLVRISRFGPMSAGDNFVGCTVLGSSGNVLHDGQVSRKEGGDLVSLYDLVDGGFQQGALDDLLAEVRMKIRKSARPVPAGSS
jgi:hypothetical protein